MNPLWRSRKHLDDPTRPVRSMLNVFCDQLISADARRHLNRELRDPQPERLNVRNGDRGRDFDTRAGTIKLAISKLRASTYYPRGSRPRSTDRPGLIVLLRDGDRLPSVVCHRVDTTLHPGRDLDRDRVAEPKASTTSISA